MMNHSKNTKALNAAIASSAVGAEPTVNIQSFDLAGKGIARVICSVNHTGASRENHGLVAKAIRQKFGGKMEAVAGSFTSISKGTFQEVITGVVSVVREAMPVTKENLLGFKSISSNMFMDEEENMWVVRKSAAGDLVVKTTGIDDDMSLLALLQQSCSGSTSLSSVSDHRAMVAQASAVAMGCEGGDFVSYVDVNNQLKCGFLVATAADEDGQVPDKAVILPVGEDEEVVVSTQAITEIHDQDSFPEVEQDDSEVIDAAVSAARGSVNINVLLSYYKKVFKRSPKFYNEFAKRIRSHAFC